MERRAFIGTLAGGLLAAPLAARVGAKDPSLLGQIDRLVQICRGSAPPAAVSTLGLPA